MIIRMKILDTIIMKIYFYLFDRENLEELTFPELIISILF